MARTESTVLDSSTIDLFNEDEIKPDPKKAPGRGRPKKIVEASAKPAKQDNATHAKNGEGDEVDPWGLLESFSPEEWQYRILYLWRCEPITNRRAGGKDSHIQKYTYKMDIDTVMREHGSGIYRFDLCRINPNGSGSKRTHQWFFTIMNPNYPPNIPLGDWIDDPSNAFWKSFEPLMKQKEAERLAAATPAQATSATDAGALFSTVLSAVREVRGEKNDNGALANQLLTMLTASQAEMFKMMDPRRQLEYVDAEIRRRTPAPDSTNATLISFLQNELAESRKMAREAMNKLDEMRLQIMTPRDPDKEIDQLFSRVEKYKTLFGRGAGAGGEKKQSDVVSLVDKVVDKVSENLPGFLQWMQNRDNLQAELLRRQAAAQGVGNTQPPPTVVDMPNGQQVTQEQMENARRMLEQLAEKHKNLIEPSAPVMIHHYTGGLTGYDFRDWFLDAFGRVNWNVLNTEIGAEKMTALTQMHEQARVMMQPPDKVYDFMMEFFTEPGQEPQEDETGEEPAAEGVPA